MNAPDFPVGHDPAELSVARVLVSLPEARVVEARLDEDFSSGTGEKGAESDVYDLPGLFPDHVYARHP